MDFSKLALNQQLEQATEGYSNIAKVVGAYYTSLKESGLPPALVRELTVEWHRLLWCKVNWPNTPPAFGSE